mgnify:CR=1 FL=1
MSTPIRALVVDDHPLMAEVIKIILEDMDNVDIDVIGVVDTGELCLEFVQMQQPKLIFLDYHLPDLMGSEVAKQIKHQFPQILIIIFTGLDISKIFNNLIEIGVSGIISKSSSVNTIKNMVNCVLDGHTAIPIEFFHKMKLVNEFTSLSVELAKDEIQAMFLLVQGMNHEQISEQLQVSKRTVDNYVKRIYDKFGVKSRAQAIEKFVHSEYYKGSKKMD